MRVVVLYNHVCRLSPGHFAADSEVKVEDLEVASRRFVRSYLEFPAAYPHHLIINCSGGEADEATQKLYAGVPCLFRSYYGGGWDVGSEQAAWRAVDCDFMVCMTARVYFWRTGWLKRLVEARLEYGEGLYGIMGSYENCPVGVTPRPNPHLRTAFYAANPHILRRFPHLIDSREKTFMAEAGEWNLSNWFESHGEPALMVTWDGVYTRNNWRRPANIFRRGNQSNILAWDKHTETYAKGDPGLKDMLAKRADGIGTL